MRKKQNSGWKLSDTDWFYFSFYNPSCFFFMIRVDPSPILFIFYFFIRSELIRPGLAVRVDPVRLLYLPHYMSCIRIKNSCFRPKPSLDLGHRGGKSMLEGSEVIVLRNFWNLARSSEMLLLVFVEVFLQWYQSHSTTGDNFVTKHT